MMKLYGRSLLALGMCLFLLGHVQAEIIYGVTTTGSLRSFDSLTPGTQTTIGTISGLLAGHTIRGIDFRPNGGSLYGISTDATGGTAQVYTIALGTAVATAQGVSFALTGNTSTRVSMDFNPAADRLRIVTGDTVENNFRWNPVTSAFVQADASLLYDAADPNFGGNPPFVAGVAYDRNDNDPSTATTLFAYDFDNDDLSTIGSLNGMPVSPNAGTMFTIGDSGIVTSSAGVGFDISGVTGIGYLSASAGGDQLFTVNLGTGAVTAVGSLGTAWLDISAVPVPEPASLTLLGLAGLAVLRLRRK